MKQRVTHARCWCARARYCEPVAAQSWGPDRRPFPQPACLGRPICESAASARARMLDDLAKAPASLAAGAVIVGIAGC